MPQQSYEQVGTNEQKSTYHMAYKSTKKKAKTSYSHSPFPLTLPAPPLLRAFLLHLPHLAGPPTPCDPAISCACSLLLSSDSLVTPVQAPFAESFARPFFVQSKWDHCNRPGPFLAWAASRLKQVNLLWAVGVQAARSHGLQTSPS